MDGGLGGVLMEQEEKGESTERLDVTCNAAHLRHSPGSGRVTHRDAAPETLAPSEGKRTRTSPACHQCAELLLVKEKKTHQCSLT